jgi:malonyl-CoA/methylmalonyl-CoA synthetase
LFHMQGLGVAVHGTFTAGIAIRILPEFVPTEVATAIDVERATLFFGVPTMFARLAESDQLTSLASLRLIVSGSAPLPVELFGRIESDCGQAPIERYGMTETVMLCSNPLMGSRQAGRVGAPLPGVEVRRASDAGVEVRGPSVFAGFFEDPDASAAAFIPDGWFKTGDLAEFDATGSLRLIGRSTDLIITGGYNVYPREVEDVLRSHPAVRDVAVVGRPDQKWGETVVAFVVSDSVLGLPAELSAHVESLAPFKRPREWQLISEIPRNAIGKMQREMLARRPVDADYHVTTRGPRAGS